MADLLKKKNDAPVAEEQGKEKPKKEKKAKEPKKMYLESNQMNFLERYETIVEGKQSDIDLSAYKLPIIIVAAILILAFIIPEGLLIFTNIKNKSLDKYINEPANVTAYNESVAVKGKIDQVSAQKANLESMMKAIASYPDVDKAFFAAIANAATTNGVTVGSYGYAGNTGFLSLSCTATTTQGISDFIRALDATGLFGTVQYPGFSGGAEGGYTFTASAYCKVATTK